VVQAVDALEQLWQIRLCGLWVGLLDRLVVKYYPLILGALLDHLQRRVHWPEVLARPQARAEAKG
jgi:hypothetical protein